MDPVIQIGLKILQASWWTLGEMAPYLLFGFLVAGVLAVWVPPELVSNHLGGRGILPILKASVVGVPLPLCSCSVIPVATSLSRHGASRGATTAFLLSAPQIGVDSIIVTYGMLGPLFALVRPLAAFVTGIVGGVCVNAADRRFPAASPPPPCEDECCASSPRQKGRLARMLRHAFVVLPADIGRPLLVGVLVAGVISAVVPEDFLPQVMGTGIGAMLVMVLFGIPLYVCATASVPIAAAMILKGISPGAALVFLMTGPASNAATVAVIWKVLGRRMALLYLAVIAVSALVFGLLLDHILSLYPVSQAVLSHRMMPESLQSVFAIVLLGVLGYAMFPRRNPPPPGNNGQAPECACPHGPQPPPPQGGHS